MIRNSKAGGIFSFVAADFLSLAPWQQLCTYDSTEWLFLQGWGLAAHLLLCGPPAAVVWCCCGGCANDDEAFSKLVLT